MTHREKNIRKILILAALIAVTSFVMLSSRPNPGTDFDSKLFALDENTEITSVFLRGSEREIRFEYRSGQWMVNDRYPMDEGMRDVFFSVLSQVEIRRPVSSQIADSLSSLIQGRGRKVTILNNADTIRSYFVYGNQETLSTYFLDDAERKSPFQVHIPGYQTFVYGIFNASENDWRSRYIWDFDWSTLKSLEIAYADENIDDVVFVYEDGFIGIKEIATLDTSRMMSYLEMVAFMQAETFLTPGQIPEYDTQIDEFLPVVTIKITEIADRERLLHIYPKPEGKNYYPGLLNQEDTVLFSDQVFELLQIAASQFSLDQD